MCQTVSESWDACSVTSWLFLMVGPLHQADVVTDLPTALVLLTIMVLFVLRGGAVMVAIPHGWLTASTGGAKGRCLLSRAPPPPSLRRLHVLRHSNAVPDGKTAGNAHRARAEPHPPLEHYAAAERLPRPAKQARGHVLLLLGGSRPPGNVTWSSVDVPALWGPGDFCYLPAPYFGLSGREGA